VHGKGDSSRLVSQQGCARISQKKDVIPAKAEIHVASMQMS